MLGSHVFDPSYLKLANVTLALWQVKDWASDSVLLQLCSYKTVNKMMKYRSQHTVDIGNFAVSVVTLVFGRLRAYAVNANLVPWKQRALYSWMTFIWFSSFQTQGSTMLANKRNMLLETVGTLFLVTRNDVTQLRRCTSECNEHIHGIYRMIRPDFNVSQLIQIHQKTNIKLDAMFDSGLVMSRSSSSFSGYTNTIDDHVKSLRAKHNMCGPITVDLKKPAVDQLWDSVSDIITNGNRMMLPFLKLFGVVEGNGLSPFATDITSANDLSNHINQFFKPPKRDMRGMNTSGGGGNNDDASVLVEEVVEEDETNISNAGSATTPSADAIASHVNDIASTETEANTTVAENSEGGNVDAANNTPLYDGGDTSDTFKQFKEMIGTSESLDQVVQHAHKLMGCLNLGKREADSLTMETKSKSRNERWFTSKEKSSSGQDGGTVPEDTSADNNTYIRRDSLIKLNCKRGKVETVEYYRVLAIFKKFYNKWYPSPEDKLIWTQDQTKLRTDVRVLARMMKRQGSGNSYQEVNLTKEGDFGPKHVFCVVGLKEVLSVECDLADLSG